MKLALTNTAEVLKRHILLHFSIPMPIAAEASSTTWTPAYAQLLPPRLIPTNSMLTMRLSSAPRIARRVLDLVAEDALMTCLSLSMILLLIAAQTR